MGQKGSIGNLQCLPESEQSILQRQVELCTLKFTFFKLFRFLSPKDYLVLAIGLSCAVIAGTATPLAIFVFGELLDLFQDARVEDVDGADFDDELKKFTLYFVYLAAAGFSLNYVSNVAFIRNGERLSRVIRETYFAAILRQNIAYFDLLGAGELTSRISSDLNLVRDGLGEKIGFTATGISTFITAYVIGFIRSWELTLILFSSVVALLLMAGVIIPFLTHDGKKSLDLSAGGGTVAQEAFNFIRNVNALGIQERMSHKYGAYVDEAAKWGIRERILSGILGAGVVLIIYLTYALCFWQGVRFIRNDELSLAAVVTVFELLMFGGFALGGIIPFLRAFTTSATAAAKIMGTINRKSPMDTSSTIGLKPEEIDGSIVFDNVKLIYPSRPNVVVLERFNLCIPAGKTTALVGPSGSGKSSVTELIERFYEPVQGQITFDGYRLESFNLRWFRQQISLVTQEPILFGTTIFNNIAFGLRESSIRGRTKDQVKELVKNAARICLVDQFVKTFANGYQTFVGERGITLSGGQKQRIALARAIISDPKILILDEATSALDTMSERLVQAAVDAVSKDRTVLVIAHRLSTIYEADKIVVMSKGSILEQGTHSELIDCRGAYYQLVQAQQVSSMKVDRGSSEEPLSETNYKIEKISSKCDNSPQAQNDTLDFTASQEPTSKYDYTTWSLIKWLIALNKEESALLIFGIVSSIIGGLGMTAGYLFAAKATQTLADIEIGVETDLNVDFWSKMFLMLAFVELLAFSGFGVAFAICAERLRQRSKVQAFRSIVRQDIEFFDKAENSVGALISTLANQTTQLAGISGITLGTILQSVTTLFTGLITGIAVGWKLGLVCTATVPFLLFCGYCRFHLLTVYENRSRRVYDDSASFACEAAASMRTVASLTREQDMISEYTDALKKQEKINIRSTLFTSIFYALIEALALLCSALALWYGGTLLRDGEYSLFQIMLCFQAIIFGADSASTIFTFAADMGRTREAASTLRRINELEPKHKIDNAQGLAVDNVAGELCFQGVHFHYPTRPEHAVLKGISFDVSAGGSIALVGESGSGKSTVVNLIEKFYDPTAGTIALDGQNVQQLNTKQYRSQMSLVAQQPELYQGTMRENIMMGLDREDSNATEEMLESRLDQACKDANIYEFISSLPDGLNTDLGVEGKLLSGGQRQRIVIARALIRKPRILLLDEATSALDAESARPVTEALNNAAAGRTTVSIAHQLKTIENCDLICVVDDGRVAESGNHQQLMALHGRYFELVTAQSLESA